MALADTFVRQVKHTGKPAGDKHTDGSSMYLLVAYLRATVLSSCCQK